MTVHISQVVDVDNLDRMLVERYITRKAHPEGGLVIYNYTAAAQYDRVWNTETRRCRGLICTDDGIVVGRPFEKFFGYEDDAGPALPATSFEVFDKVDGSLGILYEHGGEYAISTRGSFVSEQALWATAHYQEHYSGFRPPVGTTLLFEIITGWNRIVVDYGDYEGLTLLAAIDNETGADVALPPNWPGPVVARFDGYTDSEELAAIVLGDDWDNREGFVLCFAPTSPGTPSVRTKVKFTEYVRLHRIVTGVSSRIVWEYLSTGQSFDDLINQVPDELYTWVQATVADLTTAFDAVVITATAELAAMPPDLPDRRRVAEYVKGCCHPGIMFMLIDGKDVLGLLPVNPADNVLHILLTVAAVAAGLAPWRDDRRVNASRGTAAAG